MSNTENFGDSPARIHNPVHQFPGSRWIGEIPDRWEVRRLDRVAIYRTSNVDKKSKEGESPVRLCNYTDVYYHDRLRACDGDFMLATAAPNEIERFGLQVGDVLITKDSEDWRDIAVPALIEETADDFVCGYHLGILRPGPLLEPTFLFRAMQCVPVNRQSQVAATGVTRYGLPNSAVENVWIPLPPLDEQREIAAFLDRETGRIDSLIAKKRLLIERLQEYRTALITRTVTRGLPPEAARAAGLYPSPRLKPSGVEWLGDVPEHWLVKELKWETPVMRGASPRPIDDDVYFDVEGSHGWVRISDVTSAGMYLQRTRQRLSQLGISLSVPLAPGELFLSIAGSVGKPCISQIHCCIHDGFVYFPRWSGDTRFLYYVFASGECFRGLGKLGTQLNLNTDTVGELKVAFPPLIEQQVISSYLVNQLVSLHTTCDRVNAAIERLQEYRSALITAAVTGKIDVRGEVSVTAYLPE